MPIQPAFATALARLETRWGSAAIRLGNGDRVDAAHPLTDGALAITGSERGRDTVATGFPELDALLGIGGLPREGSVAFRGGVSSGKTTVALRCAAEAQQAGAIVAWLDLCRAFDPLDAASRGVDLRWTLVLHPDGLDQGFALAGALLGGRTVDLLVVDLPDRLPARYESILRRLAAHVQRMRARLICLEPLALRSSIHGALAELTSVRLELERDGWIRAGPDVVGQRTHVRVEKNRFGPPGRGAVLELLYAGYGDRAPPAHALPARDRPNDLRPVPPRRFDRATPLPHLAASAAPPRARAPAAPGRAPRPRRTPLGTGDGPRLQPGSAPARGSPRPAAGERA